MRAVNRAGDILGGAARSSILLGRQIRQVGPLPSDVQRLTHRATADRTHDRRADSTTSVQRRPRGLRRRSPSVYRWPRPTCWRAGVSSRATNTSALYAPSSTWSPIGGIRSYRGMEKRNFDDPTLLDIPRRHGKSVAQVMLRWHLQEACSAIPKSVKPSQLPRTSMSTTSSSRSPLGV